MTIAEACRILNLASEAGGEALRQAYLSKIKQFPPDLAPAEFQLVREAYDLLRDPRAQAKLRWLTVDFNAPLVDSLDELACERKRLGPEAWLDAMKVRKLCPNDEKASVSRNHRTLGFATALPGKGLVMPRSRIIAELGAVLGAQQLQNRSLRASIPERTAACSYHRFDGRGHLGISDGLFAKIAMIGGPELSLGREEVGRRSQRQATGDAGFIDHVEGTRGVKGMGHEVGIHEERLRSRGWAPTRSQAFHLRRAAQTRLKNP
jgi:hypothetical protein